MVSFTWNNQWFWGTVYYTFLHFVIIHCKLKEFWEFFVMLFLPGGIVSYKNPHTPPPPKKKKKIGWPWYWNSFGYVLYNPQNLKKEQNTCQFRKHASISSFYCLNFVDKDWLINSKLSQGFVQLKLYNRPFYSCVLSALAFE